MREEGGFLVLRRKAIENRPLREPGEKRWRFGAERMCDRAGRGERGAMFGHEGEKNSLRDVQNRFRAITARASSAILAGTALVDIRNEELSIEHAFSQEVGSPSKEGECLSCRKKCFPQGKVVRPKKTDLSAQRKKTASEKRRGGKKDNGRSNREGSRLLAVAAISLRVQHAAGKAAAHPEHHARKVASIEGTVTCLERGRHSRAKKKKNDGIKGEVPGAKRGGVPRIFPEGKNIAGMRVRLKGDSWTALAQKGGRRKRKCR